ncbi:MAG TPA: SCP2 sterol-binding domain-containing protein [Gemmatimonadales bacterium]|nr:SCP2 sterol-binding domain-containing protein [Gemmatimonadales bacterium]
MVTAIFSDAWARGCADQLRSRPEFASAAARWEGIVMLVMTETGEAEPRRVYLDLQRGECREARGGTAVDEANARLIFSANANGWRQLFSGTLPPLQALLTGKLVLAKGNVMDLVPYAGLAKQLVEAAASVPTGGE